MDRHRAVMSWPKTFSFITTEIFGSQQDSFLGSYIYSLFNCSSALALVLNFFYSLSLSILTISRNESLAHTRRNGNKHNSHCPTRHTLLEFSLKGKKNYPIWYCIKKENNNSNNKLSHFNAESKTPPVRCLPGRLYRFSPGYQSFSNTI